MKKTLTIVLSTLILTIGVSASTSAHGISDNTAVYFDLRAQYEESIDKYNDLIEQYKELSDKYNELAKQYEDMTKLNSTNPYADKQEYLNAYKAIAPTSIYDEYSANDIFLMQRVIETEVYDLDFEKKINIASVVLNRIDNGEFGDTVKEVVTSPNQFAWFRTEITQDTKDALEWVYYFGRTTDALYFRSDGKPFKGLTQVYDDGAHTFWR